MTKISEVVESLLEIQKIHGDVAVYALTPDDGEEEWYQDWAEATVKEGRNGEAIVVKIEGLL